MRHNYSMKITGSCFMRSIVILAGLIGLSTSTGVMAEDHDDKVATTIAQSWIGHDASELLTQ
jgi:hypothetical protein